MAAETELRIKVNADTASLGGIKAAEAATKRIEAQTEKAAQVARDLGQQYNLTTQEVQQLERRLNEIGTFDLDAQGKLRDAQGRFVRLRDDAEALGDALNRASNSGDGLANNISELGIAIKSAAVDLFVDSLRSLGSAAVQFVSDSLQAARTVEGLNTALESVLGSSEAATDGLAFVRQTVDQFGGDIQVATQAYTQLQAGAQSSNVSVEETNALFSEASRVFGIFNLNTEQSGRAFTALTQILGKGQLSLEELRGQLGEQLPIALQATADGLGVTTSELIELVSAGEVTGRDFALAFTEGLSAVEGQLDETTQAINQFNNQIFDIQVALGNAFQPLQAALLATTSDILTQAGQQAEGLGVVAEAGERLKQALEDNPELTEAFAASLANIADSVAEIIASGIDTFTNFLEDSPERIEAFFEPIENGFRVLEGFANLLQAVSGSGEAASESGNVLGSVLQSLSANLGPLSSQLSTINDGLDLLAGLFERLGLIAPESIQAVSSGVDELVAEVNGALGEAREALNNESLPLPEPEGPSLEGVSNRFDELETLRQTDLANQKAALVEGGATQEEIANLEQRFLEQRIQQARDRLTELRAINTEGLDAEAAEQVQQEILAAEQDVASIRLQIAEESAAQREQIAQEATQAELEALNATLAREQEVASIRSGLIEQQASQLNIEQALLNQQQGLASAQIELEREKLETRLAAAEAAEDEVAADRLREQINQVSRAAIQQEFEFKRQNLELTSQQASLDAERQRITAEIALTEAEIAIQKAEAEGASRAEINNLRQIADLRRQSVATADEEIATVTEINGLKARELDIREEIARQEQQQTELSQVDDENKVVEALEKQLDVQRTLSSVLDGNAQLQADALSRQNALLSEQQNLANAERDLEREKLETRLAQAEATGRETQAERLRQQISELNKEAAEEELEFKRRQLELANQQAEIELRRQEIAARIALTEAQINLEKARAEGASREELAGLAQIVGLRQDELSAIDDTRRANEELAKLREEQLDIEEQITQENERQSRIRGRTASPTSLRKGGPVEAGGLYQVHKDEFFVPAVSGSILNQRDSRAVVQEVLSASKAASLTTPQPVLSARETAALMGSFSVTVAPGQMAAPSMAKTERLLGELLAEVRSRPPTQMAPATFILNSSTPQQDAIALELGRIQQMVKRRGL